LTCNFFKKYKKKFSIFFPKKQEKPLNKNFNFIKKYYFNFLSNFEGFSCKLPNKLGKRPLKFNKRPLFAKNSQF